MSFDSSWVIRDILLIALKQDVPQTEWLSLQRDQNIFHLGGHFDIEQAMNYVDNFSFPTACLIKPTELKPFFPVGLSGVQQSGWGIDWISDFCFMNPESLQHKIFNHWFENGFFENLVHQDKLSVVKKKV